MFDDNTGRFGHDLNVHIALGHTVNECVAAIERANTFTVPRDGNGADLIEAVRVKMEAEQLIDMLFLMPGLFGELGFAADA
jgi:hypothetical protein